MTETGGYRTDADKNRKPVMISEYGVLTVKMKDAPDKPAQWAAPPDLFPGAIIDVKNMPAIAEQHKLGACVTGSFVKSTLPDGKPPLDLEAPSERASSLAY